MKYFELTPNQTRFLKRTVLNPNYNTKIKFGMKVMIQRVLSKGFYYHDDKELLNLINIRLHA